MIKKGVMNIVERIANIDTVMFQLFYDAVRQAFF